MHKNEIALQLTLKVLESEFIQFDRYLYTDKKEISEANEFNAKQITEFYNNVLQNINL